MDCLQSKFKTTVVLYWFYDGNAAYLILEIRTDYVANEQVLSWTWKPTSAYLYGSDEINFQVLAVNPKLGGKLLLSKDNSNNL